MKRLHEHAHERTHQVPDQAPRPRLGSVRRGGRRPESRRPVQEGEVRRRGRRPRADTRRKGTLGHRRARRVRRGCASQLRDPRRVRAQPAPSAAAQDVRREGRRREGGTARRRGRRERRRREGPRGRRAWPAWIFRSQCWVVQAEARDSGGYRASDGPVPELAARRGASARDAVPGAALDDAARRVRRRHRRAGAARDGDHARVSSARRPARAGLHEASEQPFEATRRVHAHGGAVPVPGDVLFRRPRSRPAGRAQEHDVFLDARRARAPTAPARGVRRHEDRLLADRARGCRGNEGAVRAGARSVPAGLPARRAAAAAAHRRACGEPGVPVRERTAQRARRGAGPGRTVPEGGGRDARAVSVRAARRAARRGRGRGVPRGRGRGHPRAPEARRRRPRRRRSRRRREAPRAVRALAQRRGRREGTAG